MEFIPLNEIRKAGVVFHEVKTRVFQDEISKPGEPKCSIASPRLFRDAESLVTHLKRLKQNGHNIFLYEATNEEKTVITDASYAGSGLHVGVFGTYGQR